MAKKKSNKGKDINKDILTEVQDIETQIDDDDKIDYTVMEIVDKFKYTIDQEIESVENENNNWSVKESYSEMESYYDIESLIVSMHISYMKEIFDALGGKTRQDAPRSFHYMDKLVKTYNIHNKRVISFLQNETHIDIDITRDNRDIILERIEFRNKTSKNHAKYKKIVGLIPLNDDGLSIPIRLHAKTPVLSLAVKSVVESKYPHIADYFNRKNGISK